MHHILANLALGRRKKNIWGFKKLQGATKNSVDLFLHFFGHQSLSGGDEKNQQGASYGNVTPLPPTLLEHIKSLLMMHEHNIC